MAVASSVLDRVVNTEQDFGREYTDTFMTAEEKHNSRISENYLRLINPDTTMRDIYEKKTPVSRVEEVYEAPVQEAEQQHVYLVENARANSELFRADSAINRHAEAVASAQADEEENEDLRPTQTTIQYRTEGVVKNTEQGKISTRQSKVKLSFTKKDKIIIAVALTVILALFVLIIVNSAVISNLNKDVSALEKNLDVAESNYQVAVTEKNEYMDNLEQIVSDYAFSNGMVLR